MTEPEEPNKEPLHPDAFPLSVEGGKIKTQDGTTVAQAENPGVAADIAERLNADEAVRDEDRWSA
jgi:hypothetical protein